MKKQGKGHRNDGHHLDFYFNTKGRFAIILASSARMMQMSTRLITLLQITAKKAEDF